MTYNFATKECDGEADLFNFCATPDNACDSGTADFPGGVLSGEGISELWDACNDLVYAGYEDWRVPTKEELVSVVECNDGKTPGDDETCGSGNYSWPPLDRLVFPGNFPIPWFWTSSVKATDSGAGWFVYFFNGYVTGADKSDDEAAVLCVR